MAQTLLTPEQAYLAMFAFLEQYYELTAADDVGALLGSMSLLPDGQPIDPAMSSEWQEAVTRATSGGVMANVKYKG